MGDFVSAGISTNLTLSIDAIDLIIKDKKVLKKKFIPNQSVMLKEIF